MPLKLSFWVHREFVAVFVSVVKPFGIFYKLKWNAEKPLIGPFLSLLSTATLAKSLLIVNVFTFMSNGPLFPGL